MNTQALIRELEQTNFFADAAPDIVETFVRHASETTREAGTYLFHEGDPADCCYLIRAGSIALEMQMVSRAPQVFCTLGPGDMLGVSWLITPYRWRYDAKVQSPLTAIAFEATEIRATCEQNHDIGYRIMQMFVPVLIERMHYARMQAADVFRVPCDPSS